MQDSHSALLLGLRFYSKALEVVRETGGPIFVHHGLEESRSDFDFIFSPLYDQLENCDFVDHGDLWRCMDDDSVIDELNSNHLGSCDGYTLRSGGQLKTHGRYVNDDWNSFVAFKRPHPPLVDISAVDRRLGHGDRSAFFGSDSAIAIFHDWDGVYWEIFSKDPVWVRTLINAHREDKRLDMRVVDFDLDYPNPGRKPSELSAPQDSPKNPSTFPFARADTDQ